jgi:hypothetical protein
MTDHDALVERLRARAKAIRDLCEIATHIGVFPLDCMMIDARLENEAAAELERATNSAPQERGAVELLRRILPLAEKYIYEHPHFPEDADAVEAAQESFDYTRGRMRHE